MPQNYARRPQSPDSDLFCRSSMFKEYLPSGNIDRQRGVKMLLCC
jgi:hypothetical protein